MKVSLPHPHFLGMGLQALAAAAPLAPELLDFEQVYQAHFVEVERWLRALGVPALEREDMAQEVFLVVQRKLSCFSGGYLRAWLYRIARHVASDYRRRAWFRHLFSRRRELDFDQLDGGREGPEELAERHQAERQLEQILARMSEKRRSAFVLYEIEGYSGEEIAALLKIPVATVWTRLHHARKEFLAELARLSQKGETP